MLYNMQSIKLQISPRILILSDLCIERIHLLFAVLTLCLCRLLTFSRLTFYEKKFQEGCYSFVFTLASGLYCQTNISQELKS